MSTPRSHSLGSISSTGSSIVSSGVGLITYVQAIGGTAILYDGSTSGTQLATVTSSGYVSFNAPVQFGSSGLYMTLSAGTAVVHIG